MRSIKLKFPHYDVNADVGRISLGEKMLPDPQNVCCSTVFYNQCKISRYWSNYEITFIREAYIKNISEENWEMQPIKNYIDELLNKKRGGVIFIGLILDDKSIATIIEPVADYF